MSVCLRGLGLFFFWIDEGLRKSNFGLVFFFSFYVENDRKPPFNEGRSLHGNK